MAKPFVSHDGPDEQGVRAEVWVQVGTGTVTAVEHQEDAAKQNAMVVIRSDHAAVKRPVKGWVAKRDPLYPAVVDAAASGRAVEYRIESQRRRGVERDVPITDLRADTETAGAKTISILAGLDGVLSAEAVTSPAEDPHTGDRIPAAREGVAAGAQAGAAEVERVLGALATARRAGLPQGVVDAAAALALAAGASARQVQEAGFTAQGGAGAAERPQPRRAHAQEAPPHVPYNSDHRVNLGSYAVQAAFSAEQVAHEVLADAERAAFEAHNAAVAAGDTEGSPMVAPVPVDPTHAATLAGVLLQLTDRVQVGAYGGGRPDRMANSHTRARSLVFDAVRSRYPVPLTGTQDARRAWADAVVTECVSRFSALAAISQQVASVAAPAAAQQEAAPQQQPAPAAAAGGARPPVAGEDGFEPAPAEVVARFRALAQRAGFAPVPRGPVAAYLRATFGVEVARAVHGPALEALLRRYEQREDGVAAFQRHVAAASGEPARQRASA